MSARDAERVICTTRARIDAALAEARQQGYDDGAAAERERVGDELSTLRSECHLLREALGELLASHDEGAPRIVAMDSREFWAWRAAREYLDPARMTQKPSPSGGEEPSNG